MSEVRLIDLKKVYENGVTAVDAINLEISKGEFLVLVGPSGSGKSTILRMIAGLEEITSGDVFIDERRVNDVLPRDRNIAMVFQDFALYPHMNVFDNLAFGLKMRKVPRQEINNRVNEAARILEISGLLQRKPKQLSGGEKQRVALGRAMVRHPKVFLMDEPLSNLDAKLRTQMRHEIHRLYRKLDATVVFVTHDQTEAMTLGTRIAVIKDGVIQQVATPQEIYANPVNTFVASFIGTPAMNLVQGRILYEAGRVSLCLAGEYIDLPAKIGQKAAAAGYTNTGVIAGIRPENISFGDGKGPNGHTLSGEIEIVENMGADYCVSVLTASGSLQVKTLPVTPPSQGDTAHLSIMPERILLFDMKNGNRIA